MEDYFKEWVVIFPGKMGLSWKSMGNGTKNECELQALKHCNTTVVPLRLFEHIKDIETRMVDAESKLNNVRVSLTNCLNWKYPDN